LIQAESFLSIADNSGVKSAQVIQVCGKEGPAGKYYRPTARIGDIVVVCIKKVLPSCPLDRKKVHKCVVVRTKTATKRPDGSYVRFDTNSAVMIDAESNPIGTRIFGAVPRELREKNFMKIVSLASEVV
jgi:large subunit ribosomal protein L14